MTESSILAIDRAIVSLCDLSRTHPDEIRQAGRSLWTEVEARIDEATRKKRSGVEWGLKVLTEARTSVLEPSHVVEDDVLRDFCWGDRVNVMTRRKRYNHDLDRVDAKTVYVDAQVRGLKSDPEAARQLGATLSEQRAVLELRLDPEGQVNLVVGPCWTIAETILLEVGELKSVRTEDQWWRIAVMLILAEGLDVACEQLGLPHELPIHEAESDDDLFISRDGIRWLATILLPATDVEAEYELLVQRTALRLSALMPLQSGAAESGRSGKKPVSKRRERLRRVAIPDGWVWLVEVAEKHKINPRTLHGWASEWDKDRKVRNEDVNAVRLLKSEFEKVARKRGYNIP